MKNYWNGSVPFKTVEVPSIEDPNTRAMALQSGEVDMAVNIGSGEIDLFKGNDKFQVDEIASLRVVLARINQKRAYWATLKCVLPSSALRTVKTMQMYS
mgnify:CR=1 FL=1